VPFTLKEERGFCIKSCKRGTGNKPGGDHRPNRTWPERTELIFLRSGGEKEKKAVRRVGETKNPHGGGKKAFIKPRERLTLRMAWSYG